MSVLAQYNFETDLSPTTTASGLTASTLGTGSLASAVVSGGIYATKVCIVTPPNTATEADNAIIANSYLSMTITPSAGKYLDLDSISFLIAKGGASSPRGYVLRSSVDNYSSDIAAAEVTTVRTVQTSVAISLSNGTFGRVKSSITFRLYFYTPTTPTALDLDTLVLNGEVLDPSTEVGKDIAQSFAAYLATAGFGTLGTDIHVGYTPEGENATWVEVIGGGVHNYLPVEEAAINVYVKNTSAESAINTLNDIKRYIHRMHSTTVSSNYVYSMLVLGNIEDVSRDLEYAKVFKLTVQLLYRNTNLIS